ncbi:hypothetical protein [Bradyrhizobium sp. BR 10289]|uniref:hypothetical protein n=1 Tax=Bradyrhizobium sp. BR 10289 TaxID=2749993 RepID=UPI001C652759|nr:hypothetical protein [Bradyrhizobium sp. BR 10289]MBW7974961.1 hypothetical protein [Bradyrhizobium sp. BR 10289]
MADVANQASLSADIATGELIEKTPLRERAFAGAYLTTVGVAMIGWLYVLSRTTLGVVSWMISG